MVRRSIVLNNVSKYYNKVKANDNISTVFHSHQITALIGHNGAGKSTLLKQICGLIIPTKGDIYVDSIHVVDNYKKIRQYISVMPQFQVPLKGVTMLQAIQSIAMIKGLSKKDAKHKSHEIIEFLQLDKWKYISGEKLSGGLQRLTSFAMSVIDEAPVIILDEPTNDVDPVRRVLMWNYMRKLANQGSIVIIVTHNLLEVEKYADRYIVLNQGRIIKDIEVNSSYTYNIKHFLCIYDIENEDISVFQNHFDIRYESSQKKLLLFLTEEEIIKVIPILLELLKNKKATNYELKIKNLYDNYEDIVHE